MRRWILIAAALLVVNAALFQWRGDDGPKGHGLDVFRPAPVGLAAPDVPLTTGDGSVARLPDWKGGIAVVALWATWCPVCRREIRELDRLSSDWAGRGIAVVPISLDHHPRALELIGEWYRRNGIVRLPILHDRDGVLSGTITATAIPTTMIVDRFGFVVASATGRIDWSDPAVADYLTALGNAENGAAARALPM